MARHGHRFLPQYDFDMHTGAWKHKCDCVSLEAFSLEAALECPGYQGRLLSAGERRALYSAFIDEAHKLAAALAEERAPAEYHLAGDLERLKFFTVPERSVARQS